MWVCGVEKGERRREEKNFGGMLAVDFEERGNGRVGELGVGGLDILHAIYGLRLFVWLFGWLFGTLDFGIEIGG